tara:strand:+ start:79 stop:1332 length:1254 start_codon:yes stop_codon:yes gene_type:complete
MEEKFIVRTNCRLCESNKLKKILSIPKCPVADKFLDYKNQSSYDVLWTDLDLYFCENCTHVQLLKAVDPDYIWKEYLYHSRLSKHLVKNFNKVVKKIIKIVDSTKDNLFIDIGSNDGSLIQNYIDLGYKNILGIDPSLSASKLANSAGRRTLNSYFNYKKAESIINKFGKAKAITCFNTFAHIDDLNDILSGITLILEEGGIFVFEASYFLDIYEKNLIGTIFHEHLDHHKIYALKRFFSKFDMEIFNVERNSNQGGSIVGYVKRKSNKKIKINKSVQDLIDLENSVGLNSLNSILNIQGKFDKYKILIHNKIKELHENKNKICGFGASKSSFTFITYFNIGKFLNYIVEQNSLKVGKFLPDHKIPVLPISMLDEDKPDFVINFAWVHNEKIILDYGELFKSKGIKILTISPQLKII